MVLMSESEYSGWIETMRIYSNPAQRKHIEESIEQSESGIDFYCNFNLTKWTNSGSIVHDFVAEPTAYLCDYL